MIIRRNNLPYGIEEYNQENVEKHKSSDNMLRHARYIPRKTEGIILVDKLSKSLVGYIAWEGNYIIALEVTPSYRKHGIATRLLGFAISQGASKLSVNRKNKKALDLYSSLGWKEYDSDKNMIYMTIN